MTNLGDQIYSGTATIGRVGAVIGAVFATILGIGMIIFGIITVRKRVHRTVKTVATVTSANCTPKVADDSTSVEYLCALGLDVHHHAASLDLTSAIKYKVGDSISIYYDPHNPSDVRMESDNTSHFAGWVLFVMGLFLITFPWLWVYATQKSKDVAAVGGAMGVFEALRN